VFTQMESRATKTQIAFRNILFLTDFSPLSSAALPFAVAVARKYASKLSVVHVVPSPAAVPRVSVALLQDQMERDSRLAMNELVSQVGDVFFETSIEKGDVIRVVLGLIESKSIDLVVLGTHGRTGVNKVVLGSVAETIFRRASCPVLTIGPHVSTSPPNVASTHEVLFATDFSPHSLAAAPYAISLARGSQARLSLTYVIESVRETLPPDMLTVRLHDVVPPDAGLSCRPKSFILYGDPAAEIVGLARERAVDLIVLGVQPRHRPLDISTHLPWATAHRIVTQASCPVLTVRG
jgi:nucleotide-binding universal stress UspA family protein